MMVETTYTVAEAQVHLGELVDQARHGHQIIEITEHGRPAAVVISADLLAHYQRLEDAVEVAEAERVVADSTPPVPHAEVAARFGFTPDGRRPW